MANDAVTAVDIAKNVFEVAVSIQPGRVKLRRSPESTRVCSAEMTSPNRSSGTRATSVGLSMQNHLDRTPSRPMFASARQRLGSVARVLARANTPG
jgi:hypothetical protein